MGKTTLAQNLIMHCRCAYFHCRGHRDLYGAPMVPYQQSVIEAVEFTHKHAGVSTVIDRHWPSEHVYGGIFRPGTVPEERIKMLREKMAELEPVYVFCFSDKALERHKAQMDLDHPYDEKNYLEIISRYKSLYHKMIESPLPGERIIPYDMDIVIARQAMAEFIQFVCL